MGPRRIREEGFTIKKLQSLYCVPNTVRVIKSRRLRWAGHVARREEGRSAFKILTGIPRRRWEDSIRMDNKEISINTKY